nr:hypothetical protein [uncultured Pseudomonas sp.]
MDKFAERVSALLVCENNCSCPSFSVSEHSPRPVQQSEQIAACASHPHHTAQNGSVSHKVFDRAFTQGLSVTRLELAKKGINGVLMFCNTIDVRKSVKKPGLISLGAVSMITQDVRGILFRNCNTPAFRVYDTAGVAEMCAHADIVGSKYFGKLESLPKTEQSVRNWAQRQLAMKMEFVPQDPA